MKLVKIVSDGTSAGTRLIDEDSGESIGYVDTIEWSVTVGQPLAKAKVVFTQVPVYMLAPLEEIGIKQ